MQKGFDLAADIQQFFKGDIVTDSTSRERYSHDASLFELQPKVVAYPRDVPDVCRLVEYVSRHKKAAPRLSLTARSGGTDMSGGAINDSIVVAFERFLTRVGDVQGDCIKAQPGAYYRDFEPKTLQQGLLMPAYPASRELCMIGGMVANNAGGEKSLRYGKTDRYVTEVKMVLRDGKEHTFRALNQQALQRKLQAKGLEGDLYRGVYRLVTEQAPVIKTSKPRVSKNSSGYNVWDAWDGDTFDMTKIIVGSQGTLGLITEATFRLVPVQPLSGMIVAFLPSLKKLGGIINAVLPLQPTSFESFDDHTLLFAFRFFLSFKKVLGWKKLMLLGLSFIPVMRQLLKYFPRLPRLVLLIEYEGQNQSDIDRNIAQTEQRLKQFGLKTYVAKTKQQEEKFWTVRRESFNLLRKNFKHKHTAPFIDDVIVPPEALPEFLPRLISILKRHRLLYTVAGHMGDGNFHVIPLMELGKARDRRKIYPVLKEVTELVLSCGGSLSGEHNDGLIRGPLLRNMYGKDMMMVFKQVKQLFDPDNIFNPHKKTDAHMEFSQNHMRRSF